MSCFSCPKEAAWRPESSPFQVLQYLLISREDYSILLTISTISNLQGYPLTAKTWSHTKLDILALRYNVTFSCRAGHCFLQQPLPASEPKEVSNLTRKQAVGFKLPVKGSAQPQPAKFKPKWLHNPETENALILNPGQAGAVPVVVDPYICRCNTSCPYPGCVEEFGIEPEESLPDFVPSA